MMGASRGRLIAFVAVLALGAGAAAMPTPASAGKGVALGVDVSRFNGAIDWTQVRAAGVRFAFVQASRGTGLDCDVKPGNCGGDLLYGANYAAARVAGLRVGPYHRVFIDPEPIEAAKADARAEAALFVSVVGSLRRGDLLPALDVESPFDGASAPQVRIWVRTWLKQVRRALGVRPIIYTNSTSWSATGNSRKFARAGHALWVANWGVRKPRVPAANWSGRGWWIWQYTSSGRVPGISGRVDLNRLRVRFRRIAVR